MSCEGKDRNQMSSDELKAHHVFHAQRALQAIGDERIVESLKSEIMSVDWQRKWAEQNEEYWSTGGKDHRLHLADLETDLTALEGLGGQTNG